jgi:hypothetical protein
LGKNSYLVADTGAFVNVDGFVSALGTIRRVRICTLAIAYDCPIDFITYILFYHQALYIPEMEHNLLSPFQMRQYDVTIQDTPLQHLEPADRTPSAHSIIVDRLHIPLTLNGIMLGFASTKPTFAEVTDYSGATCTHVQMTSDAPWDPQSLDFAHIEQALRDSLPRPELVDGGMLRLSPLQVQGL